MLVEFRIQNHRSIREEQALTLEAGRIADGDEVRAQQLSGRTRPLLPAAALYGANASGKSNVLSGLSFMRECVVQSHRLWPPDRGVPRDPFAWGDAKLSPSLFEATLVRDGVRYQYGFVANDERFLEEWLHAWPGPRKQTWFTRTGDKFKFGEYLQGENKLVQQVTRPNALFLSAAVQHRHDQLMPLFWWFRRLRTVNLHRRGHGRSLSGWADRWLLRGIESPIAQPSLFDEDEAPIERREAVLGMIRAADVGIVDIRVEQKQVERPDTRDVWLERPRVFLKHRSDAPDAWLSLEEESHGTRTLFSIAPAFLESLWGGGVMLVDELESSLHPLLALQLLGQFTDPRSNPRNAQLLFTTHDTTLLGSAAGKSALRRDQIWLTEKDNQGATCLYPLTDYKPRKEENLERGYLQGRYGAIPFLGTLANLE